MFLLSVSTPVIGQDTGVITIPFGKAQGDYFTVSQKDNNHVELDFNLSQLELVYVKSGQGLFLQPKLPQASDLQIVAGQPSLPALARIIEVPGNDPPSVSILSIQSNLVDLSSYGNAKIFPRQPSGTKSESAEEPFAYDSAAYTIDSLAGRETVISERLGVMHGAILARLSLNPLRYNPVKNLLQVVTHIKVEITYKESAVPLYQKSKFVSSAFNGFMQAGGMTLKSASPLPAYHPMKYVILTDTMFRKALQPFINWKTEEGFKVVVLFKGLDGVGTSVASMKTALTNLYTSATPDNPAPSYLLIVGDNEQIAAPYSNRYGHVTDLYYAQYDGGDDYFPDLFYGRFSAIDSITLANQVEKTIEYEKYLFPDPSFLDSAVLISTGDDGHGDTWGNGQINYAATIYFNPTNAISSHSYLYPSSGGARNNIIANLNSGCGFVNYTGHGYPEYWESPYLAVSDINAMTNAHKYPLVVSNGCVTNYFIDPVCFGEALLRGKDKGAIGHIGCTDDSYWDEDYYWAVGTGPIIANPTYEQTKLGAFDRTFHSHGEPRTEWYPAQGQMTFAGNLAVEESGSSRAQYYWEIYHLLGDPSLMVYYGIPKGMSISYQAQLPAGATQFIIKTEPDSYAGLSLRDSLLAASACDSTGVITLQFGSLKAGDTLKLVITKQNRKPVISTIPVYASYEPYVQYRNFSIASEDLNVNGLADYGETLGINIQLSNEGNSPASDLELSISSTDPWVKLIDTLSTCKYIGPQSQCVVTGACRLKISDLVPDQYKIPFVLTVRDKKGNSWESRFFIVANAPSLSFGNHLLSDSSGGNGNGWPEPGEDLVIRVPVINDGHSPVGNLAVIIEGKGTYTDISDSVCLLPNLLPGSSATAIFKVHVNDTLTEGQDISCMVKIDTLTFHLKKILAMAAGAITEDFETDNIQRLPWSFAGAANWYISSATPLAGNYSARSGDIGDSQYSDLSLQLFVTESGHVQFDYNTSSEQYYDFLHFYIDGQERLKVSGQGTVSHFNDTISPGWHKILWRYQKDDNTSVGKDCAWIDNLVFPPSILYPYHDAALKEILYPARDSFYYSAIYPKIMLKNAGSLPFDSCAVSYQINDSLLVTEIVASAVKPGNTIDYIFHTPFQASPLAQYRLKTYASLAGDSIATNDTVKITFTNLYKGTPGPGLQPEGYRIDEESGAQNKQADYGESLRLGLRLVNVGNLPASGIKIWMRCNDPLVSLKDTLLLAGIIPSGSDTTFASSFSLTISSLADDQHKLNLTFVCTDNSGDSITAVYPITILAPKLQFNETYIDDHAYGNGNSRPDPGEAFILAAHIINTGHSALPSVPVTLSFDQPWVSANSMASDAGSLDADSSAWSAFSLKLDTTATTGSIIHFTLHADTLQLHAMKVVTSHIGSFSEDFETGNLLHLPWNTSGSPSWYVSSINPYDGSYAAHSGEIAENQSCSLTTRLYITQAGQMGFNYKVSSLAGHHFLTFAVDNNKRLRQSGETGWLTYSDTVSAGWHDFTFTYAKDSFALAGEDFAALDDIFFPPSETYSGCDIGVSAILLPGADSTYSSLVCPRVLVKNFGEGTVNNPVVAILLNKGLYLSETFTGHILPGNSVVYQFHTPIRLMPEGQYELKAFTLQSCDLIHSNDTTTVHFRNLGTGNTALIPQVYPNPVTDMLNLLLPAEATSCVITIDDAYGRKVGSWLKENVNLGVPLNIDTRNLPNGLYIVIIQLNGKTYKNKFIKL